MNIFGGKVVLRAIEKDDNEMLKELINDPKTESCLCGISFPVSTFRQERWFVELPNDASILRCIVADKEDAKTALGTVILSDIDYRNGSAQVHIKMAAELGRGRGYGTDAIYTIVQYAFSELRLHSIYAEIMSSNRISEKLFLKCGFALDGVLRSRIYKNGAYQDIKVYSIVNGN